MPAVGGLSPTGAEPAPWEGPLLVHDPADSRPRRALCSARAVLRPVKILRSRRSKYRLLNLDGESSERLPHLSTKRAVHAPEGWTFRAIPPCVLLDHTASE